MADVLARTRSIVAKGPGHLVSLGHFHGARWAQRLAGFWRPSAISEHAFLSQLSPGVPRGEILQHFRTRIRPAFCFEPDALAALAGRVSPAERARTVAAADDVARGVLRLRGEPPIELRDPVDWRLCPHGNVDWTWELNRHAYFPTLGRAWVYTGERRYLAAFRRLLLSWLESNPPDVAGPAWAPVLEVAFRLNAWMWALYYFRAGLDDDTLRALLRGLWWHGRFLAANLEHHVRNNHLLLEAKALALGGLLLPELRAARRWLDAGLRITWERLRAQVHPDGVHAEQATLYHRIVTSELLELILLLDRNERSVPRDVRATLARMLEFEAAVRKPDGDPPLLGDSSLGDSYRRYDALAAGFRLGLVARASCDDPALDEPTTWLLGPDVPPPPPARARLRTSRAFPDAGYFVMRAGPRYLVFDCGPFGFPPEPAHGHADALSFVLCDDGRTLLVDPGAYSYYLGEEWRNYFRGTAAHNTIVVDGRDQSALVETMRVVRPARTTLERWCSTDAYDLVDGWHDGYRRLPEPVIHRREVLFVKPDYWIVLDRLTGAGRHRFDLYFHLAPDADTRVDATSRLVRALLPGDAGLLLCPADPSALEVEVVVGSEAPIQGWVSRSSGMKRPAPVVRFSRRATAPAEFITVLLPSAQANAARLTATPLEVRDEAGRALSSEAAIGLRIRTDDWCDDVVLDRRSPPRPKRFASDIDDGLVARRRRLGTSVGP